MLATRSENLAQCHRYRKVWSKACIASRADPAANMSLRGLCVVFIGLICLCLSRLAVNNGPHISV